MFGRQIISALSRQHALVTRLHTRGVSSAILAHPSAFRPTSALMTYQTSDTCLRFFSSSDDAAKDSKQEDSTADAGASESAENAEESEGTNEPSGPTIEELQEKINQLEDQFRRSVAEQENIRMIARNDIEKAKQFSIKSFAKSLLEVADNLQRAMDSVPAEDLESNAQLQVLYQGIEMTNSEMTKAFASNGIQKYCDKPGDKFDPNLHNALMQYPDPDSEPDTVGQVIKAGYTLNDRVLRPAEVGVVKAA